MSGVDYGTTGRTFTFVQNKILILDYGAAAKRPAKVCAEQHDKFSMAQQNGACCKLGLRLVDNSKICCAIFFASKAPLASHVILLRRSHRHA